MAVMTEVLMNFIKKMMILLGISSSVLGTETVESPEPKYRLPFEIVAIDDGPEEIRNAIPILATIIDRKESPDGGEYYLAKLSKPISTKDRIISYVVVGGRIVGQGISPAMKDLGINIAYVTNNELISEVVMDFSKAEFAAIGFATATNNK